LEKKKFYSFTKAREYVQKLKLKGQKEWVEFTKSKDFPDFLPKRPEGTYKEEWKGVTDWVGGTHGKYLTRDQLLSFEDARDFVRKLKLKGQKEWHEYCKSGNKPLTIPSAPYAKYKEEWIGFSDWLGKTRVKSAKSRVFEDARAYARTLNFSSKKEWDSYVKAGNIPFDIPKHPSETYREKFLGWGDWLGYEETTKYYENKTKRGRDRGKNFLPFEEAREYVRNLKFKGQKDWLAWCKTNRPKNIPSTPHTTYQENWINLADWLGTRRTRSTSFLSFEKAREYAHELNLSNIADWESFCREGKMPLNIPNSPEITFNDQWISWYDWLGTDDPTWSPLKVKELLRDLIESKTIWDWDEAVLYTFLLDAGVLNTSGKHRDFFKNLIQASRTTDGKKLIEEYAKSDSNMPPDLSGIGIIATDSDEDIKTYDDKVILKNDKEDPLKNNSSHSVKQILLQSRILKVFNDDAEKMKYFLNHLNNQLWKQAFDNDADNKNKTIEDVENLKNSENESEHLVANTFLDEYQKTLDLPLADGYIAHDPMTNDWIRPFLMQKYVAYKIKTQAYFGNFSGPGAGKTLSALIASRTIESKLTLIVCPNDVVPGWVDYIKNSLNNSEIITGNDVFDAEHDGEKFQYLVLNYDKLNQNNSSNDVLKLSKQKIDFVVLDEIHWAKNTSSKEMTKRRKNLEILLSNARNVNPGIKILGLSATPVVNNLQEGKSLLELMTGYSEDHLKTRPTIYNAVKLYKELSNKSIRQIPNYKKPRDIRIDVNVNSLTDDQKRFLTNQPMAMEQILTDVRLPEIIKRIKDQTIIYTEYLGTSDSTKTRIIDKISSAVELAGFSYGFYIGEDRSGLDKFKEKKIQVLIASKPISTGIDGLQKICHNLIFNTLPWTNAQYIQIIGRLVRTGQEKEVTIHHILAGIMDYHYDHLKMGRINYKKTLADCAVDGILPEANLVTPAQANREAVKWLHRLDPV
jgi:superfamily II DNA or RNA helicase